MHPVLLQSLARLQARFAKDDRCLGMFLAGSMSTGMEDEWSDVDVVMVIRDEQYATLKQEFRDICEAECGRIVAWLPEGERDQYVNFAFLFDVENRTHLYDFSILSAAFLNASTWLRPQSILFDKTGILAKAAQRTDGPPSTYQAEELRHQINVYWVYTYLDGKYFKRRDSYKMLYVQGVIFQTHMRVLHALYPQAEWNWWARDVHLLPQEQQQELLTYFGAVRPEEVGQALNKQMDLFSRDAQAACDQWNIPYPHDIERSVRAHLAFMGVTG